MGNAAAPSAVILSAQDFALLMDRIADLETMIKELRVGQQKPVIDPLLTVEEAAKLMKVSTKTVYRRIEKRELNTLLLSAKSYGIRKSEIEKYL
jgi:excisionase family DNA binding protein